MTVYYLQQICIHLGNILWLLFKGWLSPQLHCRLPRSLLGVSPMAEATVALGKMQKLLCSVQQEKKAVVSLIPHTDIFE